MYTVALTGGIGCGKSEATSAFAKLGTPIVDLDVISHELTTPNSAIIEQISTTFGQTYVTKTGTLNRVKMRQLVFHNATARMQLNAILHPAIYEVAIKTLQSHANAPYTILSIPLLDKNGPYTPIINRILVIDCNEDVQIKRVKQRSNLTEAEVKQIIQAQLPRQDRLMMADDLIQNNDGIEELRQKVAKLHQKYIKTCIVNETIS